MLLSMSDGVDAEYHKGSFHVLHKGIAYLNHDPNTNAPYVFVDNAVGTLDDTREEITVAGHFKQTCVLPKAKIINIKIKDGPHATYLEGGFELSFNGENYLLMDEAPMFFKQYKDKTCGVVHGTTLKIPFLIGRSISSFDFEKEGATSSKKRERMDEALAANYESVKKKLCVLDKRAPAALELAQKALKAVEELIAFEAETRSEADVKKKMFEGDSSHSFKKATSALAHVIRFASGGEYPESDDESDESDDD